MRRVFNSTRGRIMFKIKNKRYHSKQKEVNAVTVEKGKEGGRKRQTQDLSPD